MFQMVEPCRDTVCISASKYAFESSRRDLHNALLCTALQSQFLSKNCYDIDIFSNSGINNFVSFPNCSFQASRRKKTFYLFLVFLFDSCACSLTRLKSYYAESIVYFSQSITECCSQRNETLLRM